MNKIKPLREAVEEVATDETCHHAINGGPNLDAKERGYLSEYYTQPQQSCREELCSCIERICLTIAESDSRF